MFVTNWISTTKIQKISEITNFFRHYFLSRTEVLHSTPSAIAFVSFGHCIRLLQPSHSSPSATAFDFFSHRSRMCQLNEVDELVK